MSLYRIILFGKDLELLKAFYMTNFGFTLVEEGKGYWIVLATGQMQLALHRAGEEYLEEGKPFRAVSNTKIVFRVTGDMEAFRQKLVQSGAVMGEIKSPGYGYRYCDGEDPEGNVFQLDQPTEK